MIWIAAKAAPTLLYHRQTSLTCGLYIVILNYSFVDVVIDNEKIGVMALEERFSKELLERNGRKEGVVIRFRGGMDHYTDNEIVIVGGKHGKHSNYQNVTAIGLLKGFINNDLNASEVFDSQLMGRYLAIAQFFGSWHEVAWQNQRFYLNPLSLKLEPISFASNIHTAQPLGVDIFNGMTKRDEFNRKLLQDEVILLAYQATLDSLMKKTLNGSLIAVLKGIEQPLYKILKKNGLSIKPFDFNQLKQRALNVPKLDLSDVKDVTIAKEPTQQMHAFLISNEQGNYLKLLNNLPNAIELQALTWVNKAGNKIAFNPVNAIHFPFSIKKQAALSIEYKAPQKEDKKLKLEVTIALEGESKNTIILG